jgi:hypothetical protein
MSPIQVGVKLVAKFIIGVFLGLFLGASATAYGAGDSRPSALSSWIINQNSIVVTAQTHHNSGAENHARHEGRRISGLK